MELSVLITSLPSAAEVALAELASLGFRHVDLIGKAKRPEAERQALADSGLIVNCVALGRDLSEGSALDADDVAQRRRAVEEVEKQITEAAQIGGRVAYVVPCQEPKSLPAFADACRVLARHAQRHMMQLCVEHFPGSALPTAAGTLDWLQTTGLDVKLVLDLGHCLISREDPSEVVVRAGAQLGYVQLDDNDGIKDVHWPLLTGALTEPVLRDFLRQLGKVKYSAGIALELNGKLEEALANIVASKKIVDGME